MTARIETRAARYRAWLASRETAPPDMVKGLATARHLPLDRDGLAARGWDDLPMDWLPEDGVIYAGGYGEDRAIYDTPIFNPPGEEPRTVHLGLDIFAPAATPVFAPLNARVHSLRRNDNPKDYGPTLVLEHEHGAGLTFFTLYGHLGADVLDWLRPGDPVSAGDRVGELGASTINGGWAPHLHFQVMLDMQGRSGDFPGVARRSEKDAWLALCPDPRPLLGLAL